MKAAVHTRYGPPEVVRIADVDRPAVTDQAVLVKRYATTVNRTDCGFRAAKPVIVRFGAHAEYLVIPHGGALAAMPANTTFEQAAPSTEHRPDRDVGPGSSSSVPGCTGKR